MIRSRGLAAHMCDSEVSLLASLFAYFRVNTCAVFYSLNKPFPSYQAPRFQNKSSSRNEFDLQENEPADKTHFRTKTRSGAEAKENSDPGNARAAKCL